MLDAILDKQVLTLVWAIISSVLALIKYLDSHRKTQAIDLLTEEIELSPECGIKKKVDVRTEFNPPIRKRIDVSKNKAELLVERIKAANGGG